MAFLGVIFSANFFQFILEVPKDISGIERFDNL